MVALHSISKIASVLLVLVGLCLATQGGGNNGNGNGNGGNDIRGFTTMGGSGLLNWRASLSEDTINVHNVNSTQLLWSYTLQLNSTNSGAGGGFSSIPTGKGNDRYLYVTGWNGLLYAFDATIGSIIWQFNVSSYILAQLNGANYATGELCSRASPTIDGSDLYIGTRAGAFVIRLNRYTGVPIWAERADLNSYAVISSAVRVYDGKVYCGVASGLEQGAVQGAALTFRGSFVALNTHDGSRVFKAYMAPDNGGANNSWSGAGVWSSLAPIDEARGQIIISVGNLYQVPQYITDCAIAFENSTEFVSDPCRHALDYSESIVALDLQTGAVRWTRPVGGLDVSTSFCGIVLSGVTFVPRNPARCPPVLGGVDYDFAQSPILIPGGPATPDGKDALVVCQKSGMCYCMSAQAGQMHWARQEAPPGGNGGYEFGSATDGETLFAADNNADGRNFTLANGQVIVGIPHFSALNIATGAVIWQTPLPIPYPGAGIMQGVTYANGVVYGGSLSFLDATPTGVYRGANNTGGHLYALDARTGQILLDRKLDSKSCYTPSIINGVLYVACGYRGNRTFPPPATIYAFALPRDNDNH
jgi:polyvinyl alcohol dehydrogenase (cytochrome)